MKRVLIIGANDSIINVLGKKYTNLCGKSNDIEIYSYVYDMDEKMQQVHNFQKQQRLEISHPHVTRNIKLTQPKELSEINNCQDIIKAIKKNKIGLVITPGIVFNSKRNTCYDHLIDVLSKSCEAEIISLFI